MHWESIVSWIPTHWNNNKFSSAPYELRGKKRKGGFLSVLIFCHSSPTTTTANRSWDKGVLVCFPWKNPMPRSPRKWSRDMFAELCMTISESGSKCYYQSGKKIIVWFSCTMMKLVYGKSKNKLLVAPWILLCSIYHFIQLFFGYIIIQVLWRRNIRIYCFTCIVQPVKTNKTHYYYVISWLSFFVPNLFTSTFPQSFENTGRLW